MLWLDENHCLYLDKFRLDQWQKLEEKKNKYMDISFSVKNYIERVSSPGGSIQEFAKVVAVKNGGNGDVLNIPKDPFCDSSNQCISGRFV